MTEKVLEKNEWVSQMSADGKTVKMQCYNAAKQMAEKSGAKLDGTRIYTGTEKGTSSKDHKIVATANAQKGIKEIDANIDKGLSTVVGVDYVHGTTYNSDKTTDHFVAISGRTTNLVTGQKSYNFYEVGTSRKAAGISSTNVFTVQNGLLKGTTEYKSTLYYTVTQVRLNK